jgi:hypothetical protein
MRGFPIVRRHGGKWFDAAGPAVVGRSLVGWMVLGPAVAVEVGEGAEVVSATVERPEGPSWGFSEVGIVAVVAFVAVVVIAVVVEVVEVVVVVVAAVVVAVAVAAALVVVVVVVVLVVVASVGRSAVGGLELGLPHPVTARP